MERFRSLHFSAYSRPKVIKEDEITQFYSIWTYFCGMTKLLIYGFLIYLLYKLIFNVVLPVRKGVKTVRQNMEEMQRKMAEAQQQNTNYSGFTTQNPPKSAPKSSSESVKKDADYIDFEELK